MNVITHLNLKKWAENNIVDRAQGKYKIVNNGIKIIDGNTFLYFDKSYRHSAPLNTSIIIPINSAPEKFQILDTNGFNIVYLAREVLGDIDVNRKVKLNNITKPVHHKYIKPQRLGQ